MYGSESTQNIISTPQHPTISECTLDVHVSIVLFMYESPCMWILCTCGAYICDCIGVCQLYNKCIHITYILVLCCMCTYWCVCSSESTISMMECSTIVVTLINCLEL